LNLLAFGFYVSRFHFMVSKRCRRKNTHFTHAAKFWVDVLEA
jgi:hypothetical protein